MVEISKSYNFLYITIFLCTAYLGYGGHDELFGSSILMSYVKLLGCHLKWKSMGYPRHIFSMYTISLINNINLPHLFTSSTSTIARNSVLSHYSLK